MTLVQVASGSSTASSTVAATFANPVTTGNTVVVLIGANSTTDPVDSISQNSGSNSYAQLDTGSVGVIASAALWTASNVTGGFTTITGNMDTLANNAIIIAEYSGLLSSPNDVHGSRAQSASSDPTTASISTTVANDLLVGWIVTAVSTTLGLGSGYGNLTTKANGVLQVAMEDKTAGASGSYTADFTSTASTDFYVGVAAFKPVVATAKSTNMNLMGVG